MGDVAGTSVGKGFQGSIKRWGMKRGPMTHGSKSHRQHGSIGSSAAPSRASAAASLRSVLPRSSVPTAKVRSRELLSGRLAVREALSSRATGKRAGALGLFQAQTMNFRRDFWHGMA